MKASAIDRVGFACRLAASPEEAEVGQRVAHLDLLVIVAVVDLVPDAYHTAASVVALVVPDRGVPAGMVRTAGSSVMGKGHGAQEEEDVAGLGRASCHLVVVGWVVATPSAAAVDLVAVVEAAVACDHADHSHQCSVAALADFANQPSEERQLPSCYQELVAAALGLVVAELGHAHPIVGREVHQGRLADMPEDARLVVVVRQPGLAFH
jgi:hypothetical protein